MAWLKNLKTAGPPALVEAKSIPFSGAGGSRRTYQDYNAEWGIERAVRDAMTRVTWVYRCVQVIAFNAAKVPYVLREEDRYTGEEQTGNPLLYVFNSRANVGESSFAFRYRLSAQLLLSNKGVFVEVQRLNNGEIGALRLLPPDYVTPIRDPQNFVSGYKFSQPTYDEFGVTQEPIKKTYKPEDIVWIKIPHPFDPYKALTPLDAIGLSVETDWYAKMYNRNFLLNDGRPGGMVVLKGDASEEDKAELQSRFRGNIQMAGRISVVTSDQGADFVDTAVTPRDAQYSETRNLTKEEILIGFGVPESVLPNAAGRTFDNAEIERLIFWQETMLPHLELIMGEFDILDGDPKVLVGPNTDRVDVLQRMDMKRRELLLKEFDTGVTDVDEYRVETGRAPLADNQGKVLFVYNRRIPYATQDGKPYHHLITEGASVVHPPIAPAEGASVAPGASVTPTGSGQTQNGQAASAIPEGDGQARVDDRLAQQPVSGGKIEDIPAHSFVDLEAKDLDPIMERWAIIYDATLQRFVERQKRVVGEKMAGSKMRKLLNKRSRSLEGGDVSSVTPRMAMETVYDKHIWDEQLEADIKPVISGIVKELGEAMATDFDPSSESVQALIEKRTKGATWSNLSLQKTIEGQMAAGVLNESTADRIAGRLNVEFDRFVKEMLPDVVSAELSETIEDLRALISGNA